jgi:GNAT superfamily N-acetyltransferase
MPAARGHRDARTAAGRPRGHRPHRCQLERPGAAQLSGRVDATAWIDTIGVRRDLGHHGIGSALLEDFVAHARTAGAERVRTLLDPGDEALTDFLDERGFWLAPTRVVELSLNMPLPKDPR